MARYFFHIKAGAELIKHEEGSEHASLDDARLQALRTARELWADAIKSGNTLGADAIVIADEQGQLVFVPSSEATDGAAALRMHQSRRASLTANLYPGSQS
jgi:hypothetical protein